MCPRCQALLMVPPNAPRFQCFNCYAILAVPGPEPGRRRNHGEALQWDSSPSNNERWVRRVGPSDNRLRWVRVLSKDDQAAMRQHEEDNKAEAEAAVDLESTLNELPVKELKHRLSLLKIETGRNCIEKKDLVRALATSATQLSQLPVRELKARLESMGMDVKNAGVLEKGDLLKRLQYIAVSGVGGRGFVRVVKPDFTLSFVDAQDFSMDACFPPINVTAADLKDAASLPFDQKVGWFRSMLGRLRIVWEAGHVSCTVRRSNLLEDSFACFARLGADDMRRIFRFQFAGEPAQDAGGVAREWFELVSKELFNVDMGLWEYGAVDNLAYKINPSAEVANENAAAYFYFAGRLLGKALFDGQLVAPHLVLPYYKHLLAWPIMQRDLEFVDQTVYNSLEEVMKMEDPEVLCLDFTVGRTVFGAQVEEELKPGGSNVDVTRENRAEYAELMLRHLVFSTVEGPLGRFLRGFYDVIPPPLLAVFDPRELELLLCGMPDIDVADWHAHTRYRGVYEGKKNNHRNIRWFWEVVENEMNAEQRARLLQFATGTSRVPVQGFKALQGSDGNIKLFTIEGCTTGLLPRAHTCFNRLELPLYSSKEDLKKYVLIALNAEACGFGIE